MARAQDPTTLMSATTPVAITSSTDASPIVMTVTAHGLVTGDEAIVIGHTTNVAANGRWVVTKVTANTFNLTKNVKSGLVSTGSGSGAGGGTGIAYKAPKIFFCPDFMNLQLKFQSAGSYNGTTLIRCSNSEVPPDFSQTASASNSWDNIAMTDKNNSSNNVTGDTGIAGTGTDVKRTMELNNNGERWICPIISVWVAGSMNVVVSPYTNE